MTCRSVSTVRVRFPPDASDSPEGRRPGRRDQRGSERDRGSRAHDAGRIRRPATRFGSATLSRRRSLTMRRLASAWRWRCMTYGGGE